jgi:hypothetical protein
MDTRLKIAAALVPLALAACGTQEIDPNNVIVASSEAGPDKGGLNVFFPSTDENYQAQQASAAANPNGIGYHVIMDGKMLVYDGGPSGLVAFGVGEGSVCSVGYLEAGSHHFAIGVSGAPPIFETDGELAGGQTTDLFLFGPLTGLQGKFVSVPNTPSMGNEHVTVANLMRSGQTIEVVSCTDASTCTPVSPALALGDVFDADFPAVTNSGYNYSLSETGAGIAYRMVPSATVPAPPVQAMDLAFTIGTPTYPPPLDFLGAPIFMTDQGQPQERF